MAIRDFSFAMQCSSDEAPSALVGDIAAQLLLHAGEKRESFPDLSELLREAAETIGRGALCRYDVRCQARGGTMEIVVSANGTRIWQASCPLA